MIYIKYFFSFFQKKYNLVQYITPENAHDLQWP